MVLLVASGVGALAWNPPGWSRSEAETDGVNPGAAPCKCMLPSIYRIRYFPSPTLRTSIRTRTRP